MPKLDELLLKMNETGASDLHVVVGQKPKYRIDGDVVIQDEYPVWDEPAVADHLSELTNDDQWRRYLDNRAALNDAMILRPGWYTRLKHGEPIMTDHGPIYFARLFR